MALAIPRTTARTFKRIGAHYFVAGALALAIGIAAVVGAWQLSGGSEGTATVTKPFTSSAPQATHIIYLVASREQAEAVLLAEDEAALIRSQYGDFDTYEQVEVVVVGTNAADAALAAFVVNENQLSNDLGQPEVKLVDLRNPGR